MSEVESSERERLADQDLCVVGDDFQAIYGFTGATRTTCSNCQRGFRRLPLSASRTTTDRLQRFSISRILRRVTRQSSDTHRPDTLRLLRATARLGITARPMGSLPASIRPRGRRGTDRRWIRRWSRSPLGACPFHFWCTRWRGLPSAAGCLRRLELGVMAARVDQPPPPVCVPNGL